MGVFRVLLAVVPLTALGTAALSQHKPVIHVPQGQPVPEPEVRTSDLPQKKLPPGWGGRPMPEMHMPNGSAVEQKELPPPPVDNYAEGRAIWANVCSGCHGPDGKRNPKVDVTVAGPAKGLDGLIAFIKDAPGYMENVWPGEINKEEDLAAVAKFVVDGMPPPPEGLAGD